MHTRSQWPNIIATGMAMFSMFFGAGNVVFPLGIGQFAQDQNIFAILGLLITAVGVPFLGLFAMTLYDGDYKQFFGRLGDKAGFFVALLIMGLIGPFGALPRCIALSHATTQFFFPGISIQLFSLLSVLLIFALTIKRNSIIDILGYFLTPFLLLTLGIIIFKGILISPPTASSSHDALTIFMKGLTDGYQTMDLLGAFFFSSVIIAGLKKDFSGEDSNNKKILRSVMKSICIGALLLGLSYIGFSFVSALHSSELSAVASDQLIAQIALQVLGPYAGIVACAAVALACLTTAIALASVSAEFIHLDISKNRVSYPVALIGTLVVSYFVSTLNFSGIVKLLAPALELLYPSLILLSVLNICYKLFGWKAVKIPVLIFFTATLLIYLFY